MFCESEGYEKRNWFQKSSNSINLVKKKFTWEDKGNYFEGENSVNRTSAYIFVDEEAVGCWLASSLGLSPVQYF